MSVMPGTPVLISPVNTWFESLELEGCLPSAEIVVQTDHIPPHIVAKGIAVGGRDRVPLLPGISLAAGQRLKVFQQLGGLKSDLTPDLSAIVVDSAPKNHDQLLETKFKSRSFECGRASWLVEAAPGAKVQLADSAGLLAEGRAGSNGEVRLALTRHLPPQNGLIHARQAAPPGKPPLTGTPKVATDTTRALPFNHQLPELSVNNKPKGCDESVLVGNVIDGAFVTIERESDGSSETVAFDLSELWFQLSKPLDKSGDRLRLFQSMDQGCETQPSRPITVDVARASKPSAPVVAAPCVGMPLIHIESLEPGAELTVAVTNRNPLRWKLPRDATSFDAPVEPLLFPADVTVTQAKCGFDASTTVAVSGGGAGKVAKLIEPLFACATAVAVDCDKGVWLEVQADSGSGMVKISGPPIWTDNAPMKVFVHPPLTIPQKVVVRQIACGGADTLSNPAVKVQPHPRLKQLAAPFLIEGMKALLVQDAIPGAEVTVWSADELGLNVQEIGRAVVVPGIPFVPLNRPLATTDHVWLVQKMCGQETEPFPPASVLAGSKHFKLIHAISVDSRMNPPHPIILESAEMVCFFNRNWKFTAKVSNQETHADCSFIIQFTMLLPAPLIWGHTLEGDLAAAGNGLPQGLASQGYKSEDTFDRSGVDGLFSNPAFWLEVLKAPNDQIFTFMPTVRTYRN